MSDTKTTPSSIWATGMPLPESSWTWRRIFAFGITITTYVVILAILWYMYQLVNLAVFAVTQVSDTIIFSNERITASVEVLKIIVPQAMTTVFWIAVLLLSNSLLMNLYYMIAPSAEVIRGMTASVALAAGGRGAYGSPQTVSDGPTTLQAPAPSPTPTTQKGALPGSE